jgi:hypothetical protein
LALGGRRIKYHDSIQSYGGSINHALVGLRYTEYGSIIADDKLVDGGHNYPFLIGFDSAKELLLDDRFGPESFGYASGLLGRSCHQVRRQGADSARECVLCLLHSGKQGQPGWKAGVPEVKIVRWRDSYNYY